MYENKLPTFKGWTVDIRLKQLRKINPKAAGGIEFLDFDSEEGDRLIAAYIKTLPFNSPEFKAIADQVC